MRACIEKGRALGAVSAPPSKSYAHRYLIAAALSKEGGTVHGVSESEDMKATLSCLASLGARFEKEGDTVRFLGRDGKKSAVFSCLESGSTLRFMIPIALTSTDKATFIGTERLLARGVSVYEELFSQKGITVQRAADSLTFLGRLKAGDYRVRGDVSSQFITGLLFALPLLEGESTLTVSSPVESRPYIDITLDALRLFGIEIEEPSPNTFKIRGKQAYALREVYTEGDWSNAAFLLALNQLGGEVSVSGLKAKSKQGDSAVLSLFEALKGGNPLLDLSDCPDLGPILFAMAAYMGGARFIGTERLKIKESDRIEAMCCELAKLGAKCEVANGGVTVLPSSLHAPKEPLFGHNDHRIVMALSVLATALGGEIEGAEAVKKSFPSFFETLRDLQIKVSCF